jgi:hypothetical protein
MFYVSTPCPACGEGLLGFQMCSDGKTIVLVCDECDAVYLRPDAITRETALFPSWPDFLIEGLGCSIATAAGARWATLEEIRAAQLEKFVATPEEIKAVHGEILREMLRRRQGIDG